MSLSCSTIIITEGNISNNIEYIERVTDGIVIHDPAGETVIIQDFDSISPSPIPHYTAENVANKKCNLLNPNNTTYPTTLAISNAVSFITGITSNSLTGVTNLGLGTGIYYSKINNNVHLKSLVGLGNISITSNNNEIFLSGFTTNIAWGNISGFISGQTDLYNCLNTKLKIIDFNVYSGTTLSLINTKLNTNVFNAFTGITIPNNYYNKTQINNYTGNTLSNINTRILKTDFNTFTGTTLPSNYYNKTQINDYSGNTLTNINTKVPKLIASTGQIIYKNSIQLTGCSNMVYCDTKKSYILSRGSSAIGGDSGVFGGCNNNANAVCSIILGGQCNYIDSTSLRSAIIGGQNISLSGSTYDDTLAVNCLALICTPSGSGNILALDNITKKICVVSSTTFGSITGATNGLNKNNENISLGGLLTNDTTISGNSTYGLSLNNLSNFNVNYCNSIITDTNETPRGLKYAADYSNTYLNRSIVDAAYVTGKTNTKLDKTTFSTYTGTTVPANYYNKTQINSYTGSTLTNINTRLIKTDFNTYTGSTNTLIGTKLNTSVFNTFTGTTVPNDYYNKTQINTYSASTLTNINTRLLTTTFNTFSGTTLPVIYYNKTQINSYTGSTNTLIDTKLDKTIFSNYTGTTIPNTYYNKTQINNYSGNTATSISNKLNTTTFNTFTGTTLPANYYNKTQINSYTGSTLTNINSRLLKTDFNTFTGTTLPNNYYNKTQINNYSGNTNTLIGAKVSTTTYNTYTGTTVPANYYNKSQINSYSASTLTNINSKLGTISGATGRVAIYNTNSQICGNSNFIYNGTTLTLGTNSTGNNQIINATQGTEQAPALTIGNWTLGTGWQYLTTPNRLDKNAAGTGIITQLSGATITPGTTYKVTIIVTAITGSTATYSLGGISGQPLIAAQTYSELITANTNGKLIITPVATALRMTISLISITPISNGNLSVDGNITQHGNGVLTNSNLTPSVAGQIPFYTGVGNQTTNSPRFALSPNGGINFIDVVPTISLSATNNNSSYSFGIRQLTSTNAFFLTYYGTGFGTTAKRGAVELWNYQNGYMAFANNNVELMRLTSGGNLGIGTTIPTKDLSFGGNVVRTIWTERNTNAATAGQNLTLSVGGAFSGGTDLAGGNLILSSGIATGAGNSSIIFQTANAGTCGTVDRTPTTSMTITNGIVGIGMAPIVSGGGSGYNLYLSTGIMFDVGQNFRADQNGIHMSSAIGHPLVIDTVLNNNNINIQPQGAGNINLLQATGTGQVAIDGQNARIFGMLRNTTTNTAGLNLTINAGGATNAATNKNGGILYNTPGISTGSGTTSIVLQSLNRASTTGTADNATEDRFIIPSVKNLINNTVVRLFDVTLPTLTNAGGTINYTIFSTDGANIQSITGRIVYDAVNLSGVYTTQFTPTNNTAAVTTGTLVPTWSIVSGTNKITINISVASSLTPTTLQIRYTLKNTSNQTITQL